MSYYNIYTPNTRNNYENIRINTQFDYYNYNDKKNLPNGDTLITPMSDYTDEEDYSGIYYNEIEYLPRYSRSNSYDDINYNYTYNYPQTSHYSNRPPIQPVLVKCRQLPCRTWISTGSCPYNDRCVFLHDPRVISKPVIIKCRKKSQEDVCQDSCFWPTMPKESVIGVLDDKNMPHISQKYIVPNPSSLLSNESNILDSNDSITKSTKLSNSSTNDSITIGAGYDPTKDYRHVEVVYSLWSHFLDFCKSDINSVVTEPRLVSPPDPCNPFNVHTCRRRLQVFQSLSQGESICYNR